MVVYLVLLIGETIARNCESLLKKNICCGILDEEEFIGKNSALIKIKVF